MEKLNEIAKQLVDLKKFKEVVVAEARPIQIHRVVICMVPEEWVGDH